MKSVDRGTTIFSWTILAIFVVNHVMSTGSVNFKFSHRFMVDDISTRTFRTLFDVTLNRCVRQCNQTKSCTFVNYQRLAHVCSLIQHVDVAVPAQREEYPSYVSVDFSADKTLRDPCQTCPDFESCSSGPCDPQGCPPPNVPAEYKVSGNIYTIGSKLAYRCYGTVHPGNYSTCLANGSWTDLGLSCHPPPGFEYGTMSDGTIVTFKVFPNPLQKQEAMTACTSIGAALLQITTEPAFYFFQQVMNRTENAVDDYWIDGERSDMSSPMKTSTGVLLPTVSNDQIWMHDDAMCVRMQKINNYRFNGKDCTNVHHYICQL